MAEPYITKSAFESLCCLRERFDCFLEFTKLMPDEAQYSGVFRSFFRFLMIHWNVLNVIFLLSIYLLNVRMKNMISRDIHENEIFRFQQCGLSLSEAANLCCVSVSQVQEWDKGKRIPLCVVV